MTINSAIVQTNAVDSEDRKVHKPWSSSSLRPQTKTSLDSTIADFPNSQRKGCFIEGVFKLYRRRLELIFDLALDTHNFPCAINWKKNIGLRPMIAR